MDHQTLATTRQILTVLGIDLDQVRPEPRSLRDILDAYIADLATRATPTHCANVRARLRWLIDDLGVTRILEVRARQDRPCTVVPETRTTPGLRRYGRGWRLWWSR